MESTDKLRRYIRSFVTGSMETDLTDFADEIEREIAELQESWAQEAREHADDSARLAELAHENAELKREIAERYMELPVDADGVPIRLGDTIGEVDNCEFYTFTVEGYTSALPDGIGELMLVDEHDDCWHPKNCIHVKPRTVEDMLRAFYHDASDADAFCTVRLDDVLAKYADELRNMGVGE